MDERMAPTGNLFEILSVRSGGADEPALEFYRTERQIPIAPPIVRRQNAPAKSEKEKQEVGVSGGSIVYIQLDPLESVVVPVGVYVAPWWSAFPI
jgi:hypothetical protein